jgi:hypothetical protein
MNTRVCKVNDCEAIYPVNDQRCPVCREPNPIWEAREREKTLIGYESARPFDLTSWGEGPSNI